MRPEITLKQFRVLVFDVYGTLADWETGIFQAIRPTLERASSPWTKEEALLAFTSVEKDLQVQHPEMPYNELLGMVYHAFSERLGVHTTPEEDRAFGSSIAQWPVFPDTVAALAILRKYYKIVVLSNVDNNSFDAFTRKALEPNADAPIFDLVITAQDIGSYKPDPANFKFALNAIKGKLDIDEEGVLFTAQSLFHDHKPVNALGLHSAWIAREGAIMGMDADATYDFKFDTLMDMAKARESQ
ncbi:HAD-like protein [Rickenella mellea]|uniref:HAD-like protein n=1 Tax=Rickenella mellea TaxID=50990 RepID=A0A4Y7Q604_9AGAM|nr:HAD-like protein [Rickenella mellea]